MVEQLSDPQWTRFPELLNERHIQVPHVIGTFLDTRRDDPDGEYFANIVVPKVWVGKSEPSTNLQSHPQNCVLPCALKKGYSAKYLLDKLSMDKVKPSLHTAWADTVDPSFWVGAHAYADSESVES
jgi:hypothetical protein